MIKNQNRSFAFICILFLLVTANLFAAESKSENAKLQISSTLSIPLNQQLSPYTGYTREHWLQITEKIIAGFMPYFNHETSMLVYPAATGDEAFEKLNRKAPEEGPKRILERSLMAVICYVKATGKDKVPGYKGSITVPFIKGMVKGTDPKDKAYWGEPTPNDQVGAVMAMAMYILPDIFWNPLTQEQKNNMLGYFSKMALLNTYDNNHYYFHMVPVQLLDANGFDSNRAQLTEKYNRLMGWYHGDGWFMDGSNNRGFDYYNLWGFQLFNQVLYKYDPTWRKQFGEQIKTVTSQFLETYPYMYGRDGGPIPWGRSLSYRFASNCGIAWAVINGMSTLPPGEARRIASGALKYFWNHGCMGDNNLLNIGYWGANAAVAEAYLVAGDPYWANQGLACLLISETDPFWTSVEKPMPADSVGGKVAVPGAQFSIRVSSIDGDARLFPVGQSWGQDRIKWQTTAKYDQHAYSNFLGFCVSGEDGPNIGAGRTGHSYDGVKWFYRERAKAIQVSPDYLISKYSLQPENSKDSTPDYNLEQMITHTLVGNDGEVHVFWHNNPEPLYMYLGGYGISVPKGQKSEETTLNNSISIHGGDYYSVIKSLNTQDGKFESTQLTSRSGWNATHLFGGEGAFPFWHSLQAIRPNVPMIFYVNGTRTRKPVVPTIEINQNGSELKIEFENKWYSIHVPY